MKIVAIGGGNNSNISKDGTSKIYEHENIDKEIIRLSGKEKPNVLYISHAYLPEYEEGSFKKIINTYGKMYNYPVKLFSINMLNNQDNFELIDWADIIYVGGGNTKQLIDLWKESGLDQKMIEASLSDKVLCGTSSGGGCWFKYLCSDYVQLETGNPMVACMPLEGLGLVDLIFNPHASDHGRMRDIMDITENLNMHGVSLTNNMAIEIVDDEYKLIKGISSKGIEREAILTYWEDGEYYIEPMQNEGLLEELIKSKNSKQKKKKK